MVCGEGRIAEDGEQLGERDRRQIERGKGRTVVVPAKPAAAAAAAAAAATAARASRDGRAGGLVRRRGRRVGANEARELARRRVRAGRAGGGLGGRLLVFDPPRLARARGGGAVAQRLERAEHAEHAHRRHGESLGDFGGFGADEAEERVQQVRVPLVRRRAERGGARARKQLLKRGERGACTWRRSRALQRVDAQLEESCHVAVELGG